MPAQPLNPDPPDADPFVIQSARRKAYTNIVLPLFIASIIAYLDRVNLSFAALKMTEDLNFTESIFGLGAAIFFAGYVLFEIPGALIAERYSPKWWIARIMLSWGLLSGLMAFVETPWQFYTVRFLIGAAEASLYPVLYASCMPRWFSVKERPTAIAVMLTSLQLSSIIGAPLGTYLVGLPIGGFRGWQVLFLVEAIPAVAFAFILVKWMADSPAEARWLTENERVYLTSRYEREKAAVENSRRFTVLQALSDPSVLALACTYFLWITGLWGATFWIPKVLKERSGYSDTTIGWMVAMPMIISLITMIWIARHSVKTGEKRWHGAIGLFIGGVGMLIAAWSPNPYLAYLGLCMAITGVYAPFGVWWSYPTTFLSGAAAAGAIGLINSFGNVGGFVGPYLAGFLKEKTGGYTVAETVLAVALIGSGSLMLCLKDKTASLTKHFETH